MPLRLAAKMKDMRLKRSQDVSGPRQAKISIAARDLAAGNPTRPRSTHVLRERDVLFGQIPFGYSLTPETSEPDFPLLLAVRMQMILKWIFEACF